MKHIYLSIKIISVILCLQQQVSAQCLIGNDQYSSDALGHPSLTWGQGFIAECDGYLEYIQLTSNSTGTISGGTLNIYNGNTISTTPIYTQSYPSLTISQIVDPIRINLTETLNLIENNQYTFEVKIDSGLVRIFRANIYKGGSAFENGVEYDLIDFMFEVSITATLSVDDPIKETGLTVLPNPSSDFIQLLGLSKITNYIIYNSTGSEIKRGEISSHNTIDIQSFSNGLYFLKLENGRIIKFLKN